MKGGGMEVWLHSFLILILVRGKTPKGVGKLSQKLKFPVCGLRCWYSIFLFVKLWYGISDIQLLTFWKSLKWLITIFSGVSLCFLRLWHWAGWASLLFSDCRVDWKFCNNSASNIESKYSEVVCVYCRVAKCLLLNMRLHWKWLGCCELAVTFFKELGISGQDYFPCGPIGSGTARVKLA
jgi:hypothetical protein